MTSNVPNFCCAWNCKIEQDFYKFDRATWFMGAFKGIPSRGMTSHDRTKCSLLDNRSNTLWITPCERTCQFFRKTFLFGLQIILHQIHVVFYLTRVLQKFSKEMNLTQIHFKLLSMRFTVFKNLTWFRVFLLIIAYLLSF